MILENKAIITSCSNKFFPSVLNLIGSIKKNYPNHPTIYVYDLGLLKLFVGVLKNIKDVKVLSIPHFVPYWRACYTWKTYILANPIAKQNFYMDAGCQVLLPLDEIFDQIDSVGHFVVQQQAKLDWIVPLEYRNWITVDPVYYDRNCLTAGIVGFKNESTITPVLKKLYDMACSGLCLGFSQIDARRNTGVNKTAFVRNCRLFRHDTTLWSMLYRQAFGDQHDTKVDESGVFVLSSKDGRQLIKNLRLNFLTLDFVNSIYWGDKTRETHTFLDMYIGMYLILKRINLGFKKFIGYRGIYK